MKDQLASLYEYGAWVNQRLLDAAATLTAEQFSQKVLPSFGSVHLTLAHIPPKRISEEVKNETIID